MYRSKALVIMTLAALVAGSPSAARANALREELEHLMLHHPQIRAQEKTVASARQEIGKASADYLPSVTVTADMGPEHIDNPTTRTSRVGGKDWNRVRNSMGVTVTQNLFDGYATTSGVQSARLNVDVAAHTLEGTKQNVLFDGISVYLDVLRQKRMIELAKNNENTIQQQLNLEDERVLRGSGVAVDVLQAKSRLQIAKERRVTFEGALADAISRYIQIFDHPPDETTMDDPQPLVELLPDGVEDAVEVALRENEAIANSFATVEVARERRNSIQAEYMPVVDLVGAANYEKHKNATLGTRRDYSLLVSATWDLFSGFSTASGVSQAAYDYRAAKDNHDYVTRKVVEQTRVAWQALLTARQRLELLENAVNIASEVFESRKKLRDAGKETVINVLDAENEIYNAQINYTAASYDERVAIFQLLQSMGRLTPAVMDLY